MSRDRFTSHRLPAPILVIVATATGLALAHEPTPPAPGVTPHSGPGAAAASPSRPPAPAGVTDVDFRALFKMPVGPRGLEYTDAIRQPEGRRVRLLGYMAQTDRPAPGLLILAPYPFALHEDEYGMADDLPPTVVHVVLPDRPDKPVPFTPGPLLLTGTLELGAKPMPDGRQSYVRLLLDPAALAGAADHATHRH